MASLIVVEDLAHPATVDQGGHAMYLLHYLEGLRRLGHDVLLVEFLEERPAPNAVAYFDQVITSRWSHERCSLLLEPGLERLSGLAAPELAEWAARADAVITLSAHFREAPWPLIDEVRPQILIDGDPAYTHLWAAEDEPAAIFGVHDFYFTVGYNIGTASCGLPTSGIDWHPTRPPVVLDWWPPAPLPAAARFSTISGWHDYGYLEFDGMVIGPKSEEFMRFVELPQLVGEPLELVLTIDEDDPDLTVLRENGWLIGDPASVALPQSYAGYVSASAGEFSCAKGGYVHTNSGWFSDRSACYLAAGRPVVVQGTGFEENLPTGEGLFAVSEPDQAAAAIEQVRRDYPRHSRRARAIAEEYFDARRVLERVLKIAGVAA